MTDLILAIDLGKYKSVACLHDPGTGEVRFATLDMSRFAESGPPTPAQLARIVEAMNPPPSTRSGSPAA